MGGLSSKEISQISNLDSLTTVVRRHRSIFDGKKQDYKQLLMEDSTIQAIFEKEKEKNPSWSNVSAEEKGEKKIVKYPPEFISRFDDPAIIRKMIFTSDSKLVDPLADEEKELPDKTASTKRPPPLSPEYKKKTFPIKLYIAEPPEPVKTIADNLSPLVKGAIRNNLVGLFGLAHAALQIGDKMVHFLDNHFVKIDYFKAGKALYLISISESGRLPREDKVESTIADVIVEWNKFALYNQKTRNCQDFIEDLCIQLNLKCNLKGTKDELKLGFKNIIIKEFLDELVTNPKEIGFHIKFQGERITFDTHKELDDWQSKNESSLTDDQIAFLKGLHRAFQLRLSDAERMPEGDDRNELIERYTGNGQTGCVMGNATVL